MSESSSKQEPESIDSTERHVRYAVGNGTLGLDGIGDDLPYPEEMIGPPAPATADSEPAPETFIDPHSAVRSLLEHEGQKGVEP